jgi:hypothetical protein
MFVKTQLLTQLTHFGCPKNNGAVHDSGVIRR